MVSGEAVAQEMLLQQGEYYVTEVLNITMKYLFVTWIMKKHLTG